MVLKVEGPRGRNAGSFWEGSVARGQPLGNGDLVLVAVGTEFCLQQGPGSMFVSRPSW